jgi:hypothetical protein
MPREAKDYEVKPTEAIISLLNLMRAEEAVLLRAKGDAGPFRVMGSKSGRLVDTNRHNFMFVASLVSDGWLKGGVGELVESYGLSEEGLERLKARKTYSRKGSNSSSSAWRIANGQRRQFQRGPVFDVDGIKAWQRFQEDFEVACLEDPRFNDWDSALDKHDHETWGPFNGPTDDGTRAARLRSAVSYLGPDLATVLLRFFCLQEGVEEMEKRLNWPARSGKVVIAIAARRLVDYYA